MTWRACDIGDSNTVRLAWGALWRLAIGALVLPVILSCGIFGGDRGPDREALVAIYNATNGEFWARRQNWLSNAPIGTWYGVTTNASGRVAELNLSENQLVGEIPPELGNLASLQELYLHDNELSGEIPSELGNLAGLQALYLYENQLSGEIPSELGSLTNLQVLSLSQNQLSGEIPSELGNLAGLQELDLSENQLSGEVPSVLGSLTNLQRLSLYDNNLVGCVPDGWRSVPIKYLGLPFC